MSDETLQSLEAYLAPAFASVDTAAMSLPVADEGHVAWWRSRFADRGGDAESLIEALPQFQISIETGASASEAYARLIRRAEAVSEAIEPEEAFAAPSGVAWSVVEHPAGALPVVTLSERQDFERACRALGGRCEPIPIGPNVHALYVSGLPNPVRMRKAHASFLDSGGDPSSWPLEVQRRREADATTFHDRLILLHPAAYAGIAASDVGDGLDDASWVEQSMRLRLEHEFTHHATHRLLGRYRLHVHDEVLADLMGFTAAIERFDADLFLRGLGIAGEDVSSSARIHAYIAELDPNQLPELVVFLRDLAGQVETLSSAFVGAAPADRLRRMLRLASHPLSSLAAGDVRASDLIPRRPETDGQP